MTSFITFFAEIIFTVKKGVELFMFNVEIIDGEESYIQTRIAYKSKHRFFANLHNQIIEIIKYNNYSEFKLINHLHDLELTKYSHACHFNVEFILNVPKLQPLNDALDFTIIITKYET